LTDQHEVGGGVGRVDEENITSQELTGGRHHYPFFVA
jgi:hypothetical protein